MFKICDSDVRFVILLAHAQPHLITEELVRAHVAHLQELEDNNLLDLCGPFPDNAGGMVIVRVNTEDKARKIAENDPFVSSGADTYEVRRWELSHNGNHHLGVAPDRSDS